jgi:hypothetical protein
MNILVQISAVDGETHLTLVTPHVGHALQFLEREDHEGSSMSIKIDADHGEAYQLLWGIKRGLPTDPERV